MSVTAHQVGAHSVSASVRTVALLFLVAAVGGCGSTSPPADAPAVSSATAATATSTPAEQPPDEQTSAPEGMPTECAEPGELCLPRKSFAKAMCNGDFPSVALVMFSKNAPWTHGYLTRRTKAWNASGGASSNEWLDFDEEVLILRKFSASRPGGMVVSGASGGYDVLRWDGECVTLQTEELTLTPPPKPKHPRIVWRRLDYDVRDAVTEDEDVRAARKAHKKECRGQSRGEVSKACVKADTALSNAIVRFVRSGGKVIVPARLP